MFMYANAWSSGIIRKYMLDKESALGIKIRRVIQKYAKFYKKNEVG